MQTIDFQINEHVRRILAQHWIDTKKLDYGTINSVVYLRGVIHQIRASHDKAQDREEKLRLVTLLEKEIKRIRGCKGIVMKLEGFVKEGGAWRVKH